jgi:phosphate transport system permease protein
VLTGCALVTVATTLGIALVLAFESFRFFADVPLTEFFGRAEWTPLFADGTFGVWPLVTGTLLVTGIAALVALPLGLLSAVYVSQYASARARRVVKPALELLAGVPTVVYGYFALTAVTPFLQTFIPGLGVYNALSGGLVVGVMILPLVASLSEDALRSVPRRLAEGGYALGATEGEVVWRVVVPSALGGIVASYILAVSRAIGETMIVVLAAGATPNLTLDPRESVQTMTAFIVSATTGDVAQGSAEFRSLFAVGLLLFLITLGLNVLARRIVRRYAQRA